MTGLINTHTKLFHFLLARMRATGEEVIYPAPYAFYVQGFIASLSQFVTGNERLFPGSANHLCPICSVGQFASVLASFSSVHHEAPVETCNRLCAALVLDLLAALPLGLTLPEVNAAMVTILDLERKSLLRVAENGDPAGWQTSPRGERELGVRISIL